MQRRLASVFFFVLVPMILLNAALLWAGYNFDLDNDCDVDGRDLSHLITSGGNAIEDTLPDFADEFGDFGGISESIRTTNSPSSSHRGRQTSRPGR